MCARLPIRAEQSKHGGQFVEPLDADLRRAERHAGAVAFVEHPVRQLAAQIRPLVRVDARQLLAAPERRDLQRPPEQRMPTIGNRRESKTVCRMSLLGRRLGRSCRMPGIPVMVSQASRSARWSAGAVRAPILRSRCETCPSAAKPSPAKPSPSAPRLVGVCGRFRLDQRPEKPEPIKGDEAKRNAYVIVIGILRHSAGAIGDPRDSAQQCELVGRRLRIIQNDVPEKRQRAGAVVRQANDQLCPADILAPQPILVINSALDESTMGPGKTFDLGDGYRMHGTLRVRRALSKGDRQKSSRFQQGDKLAKRAWPVVRRQVHPDGAEHDEIKRKPEAESGIETG